MNSQDYCQGDAFQAEKRTLFSRSWLPLCAQGQVAKPGNYVSASVGGWSVVAVHDEAGTVRVLRNACRHQNMPVVNAGTGSCVNFRCRFHGWTYGLDGRFQSAPPPVAPPSTQTDCDLLRLDTLIQGGLLFFSIERPSQAPKLENVPAYDTTAITDIDANWKVVVEHLIGTGEDFVWPLLFVAEQGSGMFVRQVVPHTFLRTRLFTHAFGATSTGSEQSIKRACEDLQADRATGRMPAGSDFHVALGRFLGEAGSL
jgi:nitrite reductase/ring-hydroxylating ferredoxin subunit